MKTYYRTDILIGPVVIGLIGIFVFQLYPDLPRAAFAEDNEVTEIPRKGMVTMVDLGANECIPCKMMKPVMEKVEEKYHDKAAIIFIDVWKNKEPAQRFGIRVIPTQIFFNREGEEVFRHEGFMSMADIDRLFNKMDVF